MQRIAVFVCLSLLFLPDSRAEGNTTVSTAPSGIAARRWGWFYAGGALRKIKQNAWQEQIGSKTISYREMARTDDYVELYDESGQRSVRLGNVGMWEWRWKQKSHKWEFVQHGRWDDPRKTPLNAALNSSERYQLQTIRERASFPRLGDHFEVLDRASTTYNCIAWALGQTDRWVWPGMGSQTVSVAHFDALFGMYGYRRLSTLNYDQTAGFDKLVLYARRNAFGELEPTHSAMQMKDGSWSSKLGRLPLIRHLHPNDLDGDTYGEVVAVYARAQTRK